MKFQTALLSALLLSAFSVQAKESINLKVGAHQTINYTGKLSVTCVGDQAPEATIKISSYNIVVRGGLLDPQDKAFMLQGESMNRFSLVPTKMTVQCLADEETRTNLVSAQIAANNQQDYQDFRDINNQYWECTPGGLLGSSQSRNYSAKSCNRDNALRDAQFNCYQNDRFGMHGCEKPVQCYVVKMDTSLRCDYIYPAQY